MTTALQELFPNQGLRWFSQLRLIAVCGVAILAALAVWLIPGIPALPLLSVVVLLGAVDLALVLYLTPSREAGLPAAAHARIIAGQIGLDILALTAALHFAGGVENPFFPFYAFSVILAAMFLTRTAAFGFAALSSILYAAMVAGEFFGWLAHYHLGGFQDPALYQRGTYLVAQVFALSAVCFLSAGATAALVGRLRSRAAELQESHVRAEARARQMHELNDQLRAANAECKHRQQHLDALYKELQGAYDRLEVRSQHMSELNEQLRVANAECKARGEELADLNSKLQEAYRRLESRTENMRELNDQLRTANEECKAQRDQLAKLNAQLERANSKLRELDDARAQFTLLVTHELRAPVAAIQSYLKLILEGYVPEPKIRETLEKAEKRALEQLALIADLLELGRIQSADARGQVKPVQVEELLQEQVDLLIARAQERNIAVHVDIEAGLPPVLANPDQIKSVWNNLISNAIKYNRDDGCVEITLRHEGQRLLGDVSDTGIGIPPEAMPRLFCEFFRADNAKAVSRMGTGLGLSIVKEIIERSGGQITVESQLEKGTTFRFWLPVLKENDAALAAARPASGVSQ